MLFSFTLEYTIRKVIGLLGRNIYINTIEKNIKSLLDAHTRVDMEVNTKKTKYMSTFHHQNAGNSLKT
jgi:hypothetical protein